MRRPPGRRYLEYDLTVRAHWGGVVLGPYRYFCPSCDLESDPYVLKSKADDVGEDHRDQRHGGLHPRGEMILGPEWRAPQGGERTAILVFVVIMLLAFGSKLI